MSKLERDARLNRRLRHDRAGRRFQANEEAAWGELILPAPDEQVVDPIAVPVGDRQGVTQQWLGLSAS